MTKQISDIEETSLEAHVRICQERYEQLDYKLDQVDRKFVAIDEKLENLCKSIEAIKTGINDDKNTGFLYIIGLLLTVLGFFLARYF